MNEEPYIPEFITVHLGAPGSEAADIAVTFPDYIKIVAACEIYPTWPESAIRSILYVQISHALHRCMTGWYRRMEYPFDITWSPVYDQRFVPGHCTYERLNRIVDELFNSCLCLKGSREPFSFQQCEDSDKLPSHWTFVALAESGMTCEEILQNTLGNDIAVLPNLPVHIPSPFPYNAVLPLKRRQDFPLCRDGEDSEDAAERKTDRKDAYYFMKEQYEPMRPGDTGKTVRALQIQLNRVSRNYPCVPKINPADGIFGEQTQNALCLFRKHFHLPEGGDVDSAAFYRLAYAYAAAKRLSDLHSLKLSVQELPHGYPGILRRGDSGIGVRLLHLYLTAAGIFHPYCLPMQRTDTFDEPMETAVTAFQKTNRLEPDGIVGEMTWLQLERTYNGVIRCCPLEGGTPLRLAHTLKQGSIGDDVRRAQQYLSTTAATFPALSKPPVNGLYGAKMVSAVRAFQKEFGVPVTGAVNQNTWNVLGSLYSDLVTGYEKQPEQNPGFTLHQDCSQIQP